MKRNRKKVKGRSLATKPFTTSLRKNIIRNESFYE